MDFTLKTVLITGAAKRIGAVIAKHLHAAGYQLALHYRDSQPEALDLHAELNAQRPNSVIILQADLADISTLNELVKSTVDYFGRLDGLVNNASNFYPTPLLTATPQHWDDLFAVNAKAPFFLAQAAAPYLKETNGAIINMVDIYAQTPLSQHPIYSSAKAALLMLNQSLALELAPFVRVNAIAPGAILWPEDGKSEASKQALLSRTPLQRLGSPEDIAETVRWLLHDAHYITGQVLRVDGGRGLM